VQPNARLQFGTEKNQDPHANCATKQSTNKANAIISTTLTLLVVENGDMRALRALMLLLMVWLWMPMPLLAMLVVTVRTAVAAFEEKVKCDSCR
jgi:hypothetical protein